MFIKTRNNSKNSLVNWKIMNFKRNFATNVLTFTWWRQNSNSEVVDINWTATRVVQTCAIQSTRVRLLPVSRPRGQPSRYLKVPINTPKSGDGIANMSAFHYYKPQQLIIASQLKSNYQYFTGGFTRELSVVLAVEIFLFHLIY